MSIETRQHYLMRISLVFVWLATAVVSVVERNGQSHQLLQTAGVDRAIIERALLWSGVIADVALGLAILLKPTRITYLAALGVMLCMTLVATLMLPTLWLHPLGPLIKNVPIAAMLWILAGKRI
jgi:DoxX-like family